MAFNPGYEIGQVVSNTDIVNTFVCGNMGGMRRSHTTNTLVIVSDYTKGLYQDKWIGGVLHYTGMGKKGNQDINRAQNATLAKCGQNGVDVHLFEVLERGKYIYCGRVVLNDEPYEEIQPDDDGEERTVWMFPVKLTPDNDVIKPEGLVFKDMNDYKVNGKNADAEHSRRYNVKNNRGTPNLKGKKLRHKTYGLGTVVKLQEDILFVNFEKNDKRTLNYSVCIENNIIEFVD